ncbi:OLC1v1019568C1 [Oldenlandia corymbosa var. corymbosa]|uniref:OLC1v1019568C1 n=1 Tax=Oldenlandia corymbosa var. corymbosa TaxID=529605 RepID=A0AAV1EE80_OLDCO|nr:OLC1v1019568C1 [Oldenlandia corymbosa var. corymbosa]
MQHFLTVNWGLYAQIIHCDRNFYVIQFLNKEKMLLVLHNGPYAIDGGLLLVHRWNSQFSISNLRVTKLSIWSRLHHVPLDCFNPLGVRFLAEQMGEVEKVMDDAESLSMTTYIRAKIWIKPHEPLNPSFYVTLNSEQETWLECRYERMHCGQLAHPLTRCLHLSDAQLESYLDEYFFNESARNNALLVKDNMKKLFSESMRAHGHKNHKQTSITTETFVDSQRNYFATIDENTIINGFEITMRVEHGLEQVHPSNPDLNDEMQEEDPNDHMDDDNQGNEAPVQPEANGFHPSENGFHIPEVIPSPSDNGGKNQPAELEFHGGMPNGGGPTLMDVGHSNLPGDLFTVYQLATTSFNHGYHVGPEGTSGQINHNNHASPCDVHVGVNEEGHLAFTSTEELLQ